MNYKPDSPKTISTNRQPQTIRSKIQRHYQTDPDPQVLEDTVVIESPLEICLQYKRDDHHTVTRPISLTMRTPGADAELALGYLYNEGILQSPNELTGPVSTPSPNHVSIPFENPPDLPDSRNLTTSSCGICSSTSLQTFLDHKIIPLSNPLEPVLTKQLICSLPDLLLQHQAAFSTTGGLHAAAIFDPSGKLHTLQEDIGRHNAVDKVAGCLFQQNQLPVATPQLLLVSGRTSYEIVQKTLKMRIPILVGIGPPSSLAIEIANQAQLTLIGFLSGKKFNVYSAPERLKL